MNLLALTIVIVLYVGAIGFLGIKGYRQTKNTEDFLLGGRNIPSYIMALSYGAAFISTSAIVGFGGAASQYGLSLLWLAGFNIFFGILIAFIFVGKKTRRIGLALDAHTFSEFIGRRSGSKFLQYFTAVIIFVFMPLYAAAVMIGAARIMEGLLNVPFMPALLVFAVFVAVYVMVGGLKGIMYIDALQGLLMFLGMLLLLIVTYHKLGGVVASHRALTNLESIIPPDLFAKGHRGWTAGPELFSERWWILWSSLLLGVGIGALSQPQLVVRYFTVKSGRDLNRSVIVGAIFIMITVGTPYIVGALSNVFYMQREGQLAFQAAGGNIDLVIPNFIRDIMPGWFGYVFLLVILSAAMSTLSSQFHTIGTAVGRDLYETGIMKGKTKTPKGTIYISRLAILVSLVLTVILSKYLGTNIVARATAIFFGIMASGYLAPYILSLYWKRLTRKGMIAGIVSGLIVCLFAFLFLHIAESKALGVSQLIFGRPAIIMTGSWKFVDPMMLGLPVSIFFTVIVSLFTKVENQETVKKCFAK